MEANEKSFIPRGSEQNAAFENIAKIIATVTRLVPTIDGGLETFRTIDLDETEEEIKATKGQLYGIEAFNITAAPQYLKLYDVPASEVTVGTTTPLMTLVVPGESNSDGAGFVVYWPHGLKFARAIVAATTTDVSGNTGAGANESVVAFHYI